MKYIIGTRGSRLALTQAEYVCKKLRESYPQEEFEIQVVKTRGDLILDKPLHEIGDRGVFVREIEEKLLSGEIHLGVHSMKDMPARPASGLAFTRAWKREDPRDVLILREKSSLEELPQGAVIGTGSKRREFQLKRLRPDLNIVGIRGNVDTRLRKMEEEKLDGIVLAAAGLHRLSMQDKITQYLEPEEMIPAPAQGILALEIREGEEKLKAMLDALSHEETAAAALGERSFLQEMGASCHLPVGAVLRKEGEEMFCLRAMFGNESGSRQAYASVSGREPEELAREEDLGFLCGHYEGIDERVLEEVVTDHVSIGDYVLTGGELPAMVMVDTISRLVPGVLHNDTSAESESFQDNLLEHPQYSRPEVWHGKRVPEVLLSGHHANIQKWKREQSILRTRERRPDLLKQCQLTEEERRLLADEEYTRQKTEESV